MFEVLLELDKKIIIFLNNLGSEKWDSFWLFITNQLNWSPLFAFILFLIFKNFGLKKGGGIFLFIVIMVAFSDQFTNLIRAIFERLRPVNNQSINQSLRVLIKPQSYSFTSGHATTSMAFTVFIYYLFKNKYRYYIKLLFIFPIIFAYSRLYLGVHFLSDVLFGGAIGVLIGISFFKIYKKVIAPLTH